MVVHGGIDGYSRFVVFLTCNNNNKSETVFQLFEKAIHEYGVPDRIRTDKGGENIKVRGGCRILGGEGLGHESC